MENGKNSIFSSQMCVKLTSFSYGCDCPALCLFLPCPLPWLCGGCAVPAGWSHPAQTRRAWEHAAFVRTRPILMSTPSPLQLLSVRQGAQAQGSASPPLLLGRSPHFLPSREPAWGGFGEHAGVSLQGRPCLLSQFQADFLPESCWQRPADRRCPGFPLV